MRSTRYLLKVHATRENHGDRGRIHRFSSRHPQFVFTISSHYIGVFLRYRHTNSHPLNRVATRFVCGDVYDKHKPAWGKGQSSRELGLLAPLALLSNPLQVFLETENSRHGLGGSATRSFNRNLRPDSKRANLYGRSIFIVPAIVQLRRNGQGEDLEMVLHKHSTGFQTSLVIVHFDGNHRNFDQRESSSEFELSVSRSAAKTNFVESDALFRRIRGIRTIIGRG